MDGKVLLSVRGLTKSFLGVKALDGVNLDVEVGEVHGIIGENGAGKSTLMNCIFGVVRRDSGKVFFCEEPVDFKSPAQALNAGIAMIHQETNLIQQFTASENIWLNRENRFIKRGVLNNKARDEATQKLFDEMGISILANQKVMDMSVAHCQLVEVVRAVSCDAKLIIMDEPTSSLAREEVEILYQIIRSLTKRGTSVIYISHKIEEMFHICDKISVYRDGKYVNTFQSDSITYDDLIAQIVGRKIETLYPKLPPHIGDVILETKGLTRYGEVYDVNIQVHSGEILGISGLDGAGRTELVEALFGITVPDKGEVYFEGKKVVFKTPADSVAAGLGMVTEDRRRRGIIPQLSVGDNMSVVKVDEFSEGPFGFVNRKKEKEQIEKYVDLLKIKISDINQRIDSLSGGNQQKAIIARWLMKGCKLLILDEPTRGIDVGSKSEIYKIMSELAHQGVAIVMVSSELPEILGMSDRIIVLRDGRVVFSCDRSEATQEILGSYALGK